MIKGAASYHDQKVLSEMLRTKRNVKPIKIIEFVSLKSQSWIDEDSADEIHRIRGVDQGLQTKGESGWGAEMLGSSFDHLAANLRADIRKNNSEHAMFGGSCVYGYGRIANNLRTNKEFIGLKPPGRDEVRLAMLRCRFPPMVNAAYGVTPLAYQLNHARQRRTYIGERPTFASDYHARRKVLFTKGHEFQISEIAEAAQTEAAFHAEVAESTTWLAKNEYLETDTFFTGNAVPFPFLALSAKDEIIRERVIVDYAAREPTTANLVQINNYARAGAKYEHKLLYDVMPSVLADAARIDEVRRTHNARFASMAMLSSKMPSYEADEKLTTVMRSCNVLFGGEWAEIRRSNPQYFLDSLVTKTDKYKKSKLFSHELRLYVESTKCEQLVISGFTQGVQALLKRRNFEQSHAAGVKHDWPHTALYTTTTFGYTFTHGGQDNLMHALTSMAIAGAGVAYVHNGDDNLIVVRTKKGMCVFMGDLKTFDWTQTLETKKPVIDAIVNLCGVIDPSGAALWKESLTDMMVVMHGVEVVEMKDPNPSGKNLFAEIGDIDVEILLNRCANQLRAKLVVEMDDPSDTIESVFVEQSALMGYKGKLEGVKYVPDVSTLHEFLQVESITYLGYVHYTPPMQDGQKYLSTRCHIDIKRWFLSILYNSSPYEKDHDLYRLGEATRMAGMLLQFGTPTTELAPFYNAMVEYALAFLDKVEGVEAPDEEDDYLAQRAPAQYKRGEKMKKRLMHQVTAIAASDEVIAAIQSVQGLRAALKAGSSMIWTDKTAGYARLREVLDADDVGDWSADVNSDALETYIKRPATLSERVREAADLHALTIDMYTLNPEDIPYMDLPPTALQPGLQLQRRDMKQLIKENAFVNWDNWGRVNVDPQTRAEATQRRKQQQKHKKEIARLHAEEAGLKVKPAASGPQERDLDRTKGSLKTAKEEAEHDPFDSYSAAKNMGPNARKKK